MNNAMVIGRMTGAAMAECTLALIATIAARWFILKFARLRAGWGRLFAALIVWVFFTAIFQRLNESLGNPVAVQWAIFFLVAAISLTILLKMMVRDPAQAQTLTWGESFVIGCLTFMTLISAAIAIMLVLRTFH